MNRMVVMRSRFLDPLERNRLDATVDVRVSARYGTSTDTSLSPMYPSPNFSNVKRFALQGPSGYGDLSFPVCYLCHGQGTA